MVKFSFAKIFLFISLLSYENLIVPINFYGKSKKTKGEFFVKTDRFHVSREFVESFLTNHPILSTGLLCTTLGYYLYPKQVEALGEFIEDHQHIFFVSGLVASMLAYKNKKKILNYLVGPAELDEDEDGFDDYAHFSKSGVRIYGSGEIKTTFDDVAGLQTAKEDLSDILMFLQHPKKFKAIGAHAPKGVLLSGPPGNGKTLLARALAGEAQCPFLYITASEFIEAIVGVGASRIRSLFSIAKDLAPCIIFIDEIDSIGRKRSASGCGSDTELTQCLNQLLAEMDGFEQQEDPIIIIGATNRADVLDEALLRPGRFDRKIDIHLPYIKDRYEILKVHFKNVKIASDINLEQIACGTVGFSGADLANLVNEAAILALREGKIFVEMQHVDQARDSMLLGRETKGMDLSEQDIWKTAVHESGHAIAAVYQDHATPLYKVTITPRGGALGITYTMDSKEQYSKNEEELRAEIVVFLSGSVAEELILGRRGIGARSDLESARELATAMVMWYGMTQEFKDVTFVEFIHSQVHLPDSIATKLHQEVGKIIGQCRAVACQIVTDHKAELLQLAEMLVDQGTVSGEDVYVLCQREVPPLQFSF